MSRFSDHMDSLFPKEVPEIHIPRWQREWRSVYGHRAPHCRARLKDGEYCQNAKFPGSQFCRTHADIKFQQCSETTKKGDRCKNRPYKDGLCHTHLDLRNASMIKERMAELRATLESKRDLTKLIK